ncbi:MAG: membrane lipoprotein lipid attachment site-containing protein [Leadbetterella sp.]|nr:membrane lipoprotein lipid attachment site-containing protein [Leadbetterella sp.]
MKKTILFLTILLTPCLSGCNIFDVADSLDKLEPEPDKKIAITFKLNGKSKEMEDFASYNVSKDEFGELSFQQMFYEEINFSDYLSLIISVKPYIGVGKYSVEKNFASISYSEVKNISDSQDWEAIKGTIEITRVKNGIIEGIVNATLVHEKKQRPNLEVTDGKFKIEIREP